MLDKLKQTQLLARIKLAWNIIKARDGILVDHAKYELRKQLILPKDDFDRQLSESAVDILRVFSLVRHSGFSASWQREQIDTLLQFLPLSPLTGEHDEWIAVDGDIATDDMMFQNRRASSVFKRKDGTAYNINSYNSGDITFPYDLADAVPDDMPALSAEQIEQAVASFFRSDNS